MRVLENILDADCFISLVENGPAIYSANGNPIVLGEEVSPKEFRLCQVMARIALDPKQKDAFGAIQGFVKVHNEFLQEPQSGPILVQTEGGIKVIIV